jgi:hypothetical protein
VSDNREWLAKLEREARDRKGGLSREEIVEAIHEARAERDADIDRALGLVGDE